MIKVMMQNGVRVTVVIMTPIITREMMDYCWWRSSWAPLTIMTRHDEAPDDDEGDND